MKRLFIFLLVFFAPIIRCSEEEREKYFIDTVNEIRAAVDGDKLDQINARTLWIGPHNTVEPVTFERYMKRLLQHHFVDPGTMKLVKFKEINDRALLVFRKESDSKDFVTLMAYRFEKKNNVWNLHFDAPEDQFRKASVDEDEKAVRKSLAENPAFEINHEEPWVGMSDFTARQNPDKRNYARFLDQNWFGFVAEDLLYMINNVTLADQSAVTKKQWRAFLNAVSAGADDQRAELLKCGVMSSASGNCLLTLEALSTLLDPVLSIAKRLDLDIRDTEAKKLAPIWKPIYELIVQEQFEAASPRVEAVDWSDINESTKHDLTVFRQRLEARVHTLKKSQATQK